MIFARRKTAPNAPNTDTPLFDKHYTMSLNAFAHVLVFAFLEQAATPSAMASNVL